MPSTVFHAAPEQLAEASERARATFKYFWRDLYWEGNRIVPAFHIAGVKIAFEDGDAIEHMWVGDVGFDGKEVTGELMNEPNELGNVHEGDAIRVPLGRVEDWMLAGAKRVYGAFSVQAMRASMTKRERREHDEAWGLEFGDPAHVALPSTDDDHPMAVHAGPSVEKYVDANADALTRRDDAGFRLLHREALAGNAYLVRILLARGADASARTASGQTPLGLARALGWPAVEALLVAAGARE
jgi:uncharacterized protein YegJ (DUF2314 family)